MTNTEVRNKIAAEIRSYRRTAKRLRVTDSNAMLTAISVLRSFAAEFPKPLSFEQQIEKSLAEIHALPIYRPVSVDLSDPLASVRAAKMRDCWS